MTREEEINNAANLYGDSKSKDTIINSAAGYDFAQGAHWADSHPKSPWISVKDDLPCNHEELMTVDDKGRPETKRVLVRIQETDTSFQRPYYADCMMSKWDVEEDKFLWHLCSQGYITHWMPIPDLPKE